MIKMDQPNSSFLKYIGSYKYNTTEDGKITLKRYYLSQRIKYTWIDSFMMCKSVGMRLAYFEAQAEIKNLTAIARKKNKLFISNVFIDGLNLTNNVETPDATQPCYSVRKQPRNKLEIRTEECYGVSYKFLCEDIEVVDSYDDPFHRSDTVDVKATFFTDLGNFAEHKIQSASKPELNICQMNEIPEKKRYYAGVNFKTSPNNVPKICQSFDMKIASPINQAEYDNLVNLLRNSTTVWDHVTIAGFRSEENGVDWVSFNNKVNYEIDWNIDEPNNDEGDEDCIGFKKIDGEPKMNDIPCSANNHFICEFDDSINHNQKLNKIDPSRFLKPLTNYNFGSYKKEIFLSVYSVDWLSALINCKNFGMELVTSSSEQEDEILRNKLKNVRNIPSSLHVGASAMGTDDTWYAIHTGEIFNYDLEWTLNSDYYQRGTKCLKLKKYYTDFSYDVVNCMGSSSRFICQKIGDRTGDEESITSTSEGSLSLSLPVLSSEEFDGF